MHTLHIAQNMCCIHTHKYIHVINQLDPVLIYLHSHNAHNKQVHNTVPHSYMHKFNICDTLANNMHTHPTLLCMHSLSEWLLQLPCLRANCTSLLPIKMLIYHDLWLDLSLIIHIIWSQNSKHSFLFLHHSKEFLYPSCQEYNNRRERESILLCTVLCKLTVDN